MSAEGVVLDMSVYDTRARLLMDTVLEIGAQDDEWGQQDHPYITIPHSLFAYMTVDDSRSIFADMADKEKAANAQRAKDGELDWRGILAEEVFEALAEADPAKAIVELVQVAAVAIQAAASIERNGLGGAA